MHEIMYNNCMNGKRASTTVRIWVLLFAAVLLFAPSLYAQDRVERAGAPVESATPLQHADQQAGPGAEQEEEELPPDQGVQLKKPPQITAPRKPAAPAQLPPGSAGSASPLPARQPSQGARMVRPQASQGSTGGTIHLNFDNVELRDLIRFISNVMGKNIVFDENLIKGRITLLSPKDLTKDEVFRLFVSTMSYFGFAVVPTPEAIKIVRQADAKGMALQKLEKSTLADLPPEDRFMTYVHNLEYLDANTMVGVLRPMMSKDAHVVGIASTNSLILVDTGSNIQRIRKILVEIDIPISKQLGSLKVYNVQHTNAVDLAKTIQALLSESKKAQTPKEKIFVTSYASTNALLISAPPEDMMEIERIISELDTLRPQVLVEAAIVEVTTTKGEQFGVEWLVGPSSGNRGASGGFVTSPSSNSNLVATSQALLNNASDTNKAVAAAVGTLSGFSVGVTAGNITYNGVTYPAISSFIRALSTQDNVNILSTPQLLTVNNEEAEIIVGENRPYQTSSRLDATGNPTYSYEYKDVGIKLKIKPQINKDGFVNLNIYQEVSQISTTSNTGALAPTTLKRSTKTTVVVKDSQTVVISGLIKDNLTAGSQGIPFLSSIPIIGYLFGYKTKTNEKTNLLVFLTPRIIYTSDHLDEVSRMKREEQERMLFQDKKK